MTNPNVRRPSEFDEPHRETWFVPIVACRRGTYRDALGGALKFLEAYWHLWDPEVEVRFVSGWTGSMVSIGLEVSAEANERAKESAENIRATVAGSQHRVTVGLLTQTCPWPAPGPITYEMVPREVPDGLISERSLVFAPHFVVESPFHVILDLIAPSDPSGRQTAAGADSERSGSEGSELRDLVSVALHGGGTSAPAIAALLAADSSEDGFLVPVPAAPGVEPRPRPMPTRLVAHLLALPARVGEMLPEIVPAIETGIHDTIEHTPTPHVLVLGASGQGKSTCLTEIGRRSLKTGRSVVAIDVHDANLVRALYEEAVELNRPALYVNLALDQESPRPTLPLWLRPPGMGIDRHIDEQFDILRNDAWADSDRDWWGPVGTRLTRAGIALVAKDPARQFGLSQLPRLLDPSEKGFRRATLDRIDDPSLTRLVEREVMPMITSAHADNAMTWVLAKFEPFAAPQVASILESPTGRVPIDEALVRGYSLFVHVPIGAFGAVPGRMIAGLVLHRAFSALLRGGLPNQVDFIQDEYHLYASSLTNRMLAESRKFGARLILANQNLAQLARETRDTVLGNVGSVACYRLNPADAMIMDGLFPTIPIRVLQTLRPHTIALTTFARDEVVAGPAPVADTGRQPPPWSEQLGAFWDGEEPRLPDPGAISSLAAEAQRSPVTPQLPYEEWSEQRT
jgi:hypothetical protein